MTDNVDSVPSPAPDPLRRWRLHLGLFLATTFSVFLTGASYRDATSVDGVIPDSTQNFFQFLLGGWTFAVPLLAILVCHEFGHWIAARIHRVPASLPYFLPLPFLSLIGTLGAVIAMPSRIRSRNALLDIGAAGPIAGLVVTIPVLIIGLHLSTVSPLPPQYEQEGQSLLYSALKWATVGTIPPGHDVFLHPTAFAGWAGLLLTMINLLPWGQLDGGHIAFALFGEKQHLYARWMRYGLLLLFAYNLLVFVRPVLQGSSNMSLGQAIGNSMFWLVWFVLTGIMGRAFGPDHPPFEPGPLSPGRRIIAAVTLLCFVLLFMPTPLSQH
jgi:membrane-associated protease RseP (regulator of RpoE activity)